MSAAHSDEDAIMVEPESNDMLQADASEEAEGLTSGAEAEIEDDTSWTLGDFEIISVDRVRFKVQSYFLYASSSVFRDAHSLDDAGERKLILNDEFEDADAVRAFLDLVAHGHITQEENLQGLKDLVRFLDKWGCETHLSHLCALLELAVRRDVVQGLEAFDVAAQAYELDLCHLILETQETRCWPALKDGEAANPRNGSPGEVIWNPRHWPAWMFETGPPSNFMFALSRAYGSKDATSLADEFKKRLNETRKAAQGVEVPSSRPDEIVADEKWDTGDVEILSSDRVQFLVPRHYLLSSSAVYREKYGGDSLTGRPIEPGVSAAVIRLYLQVASRGFLKPNMNLIHWKELAKFLVDWDCEAPLNIMKVTLENAVRGDNVNYCPAFIAAATAEHDRTCAFILKNAGKHTWLVLAAGQQPHPLKGTAGKSVWDPSHWPWDIWGSGLKPKYLFAVARAYGDGDLSTRFNEYLKVMSDSAKA